MQKEIEVLDAYFKHSENRGACAAYDSIRKELVVGQKPTTNTARVEMRGFCRKCGNGMCEMAGGSHAEPGCSSWEPLTSPIA